MKTRQAAPLTQVGVCTCRGGAGGLEDVVYLIGGLYTCTQGHML